jgi:hypothetical protein
MAPPRLQNYLILFLALTTVAGGAFAWNQYQQLVRVRAAGTSDRARADLQKRLLDLEKRRNELEAEVAGLRARSSATANTDAGIDSNSPDTPPPPPDRPGPGRFDRRGGFNNLAALLENPEFNKLWTDQQKARLSTAYAGLFKRLNLRPEESDRLTNLLIEKQMALMDVLSAARAQGLTGRESRDEVRQLVQQTNTDIEGQIQSLLGTDRYTQYNAFLQTQTQRNQVNALQTMLVAAGVPMQEYQSEQLVQILAQTNSQAGGGQRGGIGGFLGGAAGGFGSAIPGPAITKDAVVQASGVLTTPQLQVLQQVQQEQAAQRKIAQLLRETSRGSGASAAGSATTGQPTTPSSRPVTSPGGG